MYTLSITSRSVLNIGLIVSFILHNHSIVILHLLDDIFITCLHLNLLMVTKFGHTFYYNLNVAISLIIKGFHMDDCYHRKCCYTCNCAHCISILSCETQTLETNINSYFWSWNWRYTAINRKIISWTLCRCFECWFFESKINLDIAIRSLKCLGWK